GRLAFQQAADSAGAGRDAGHSGGTALTPGDAGRRPPSRARWPLARSPAHYRLPMPSLPSPSSPPVLLRRAASTLDLTQPVVMGVLNVTPDSFSDGGRFASADAAVDAGLRMAAEGAALIDVGGESTRPGAQPVGLEDELQRVLPVIERLRA